MQTTVLQYPSPRFPKLKRPESLEELVAKTRKLVTSRAWDGDPQYMNGGWGITPEDKVLLGIRSDTDQWVIDAAVRAIREQGATVDVYILDYSPVGDPYTNSAQEVIMMDQVAESINDDFNFYYTRITNTLKTKTVSALVDSEKYTRVIAGTAGPFPAIRYPWHRYNYTGVEEFQSGMFELPYEVQKAIDDKTWSQIQSVEKCRLTDPEGTDVTYTNYNDKRAQVVEHEFVKPINIGYGGVEDSTGVIAGTTNHLGPFPNVKAHIKDGLVVKVEGGGIYGDEWRKRLEKYKDVTMPPYHPLLNASAVGTEKIKYPRPGFFWWMEMALGTNPKALRLPKHARFSSFANHLEERKRSGVIHNGFGYNSPGSYVGCVKEHLPWIHCHIHLLFPTVEGVTKSGERVTIVDRGHLTSLDDPEVRNAASKFGDPDKLLSELWIPSIPGINAPGEYMRDYGRDPISWIGKEAKEHPTFED